ncbi:MAG: glycoside hydrolase family 65 protein [Chloroflexi bacterium]|nr:glycoside hydrolase family 65 protein [Chloroflexota bacterium]
MTDFSFDYAVIDRWMIDDTAPFDIKAEVNKATVFALANGYMGSRGAPESVTPDLPALVGNHINGIYDSPSGGILDREMINLPDWRFVQLEADGETLTVEGAHTYRRQLDMQRGLLLQQFTWRTEHGKTIRLSSERLVSLHRLHLAAIRWRIESDADCSVVIRSRIDTNVNNRFAERHFEIEWIRVPHTEVNGGAVTITTIQQGYQVCITVQHDLSRAAEWSAEATSGALENVCRFGLSAGEPVELVKWAAVYDSRFSEGDLAALCLSELETARRQGYEAVRAAHEARWAERWSASDVVIEGDDESQAALRFCLFHLLANTPHSDKVSISARGLQGQDYWGSIFWDCEIYVLPFLISTQPEYARRCLMYRYHTLDGARRKAASLGFGGAYYAWQSQETGDETCALYVFDDPLTGQKIRSYFADEQVHISADVVYALWQYAWATGDTAFLYPYGLEIAVEVARFFVSRVSYDAGRDVYELRTVLGPDEYHERINNNAYTNRMAQHALIAALALVKNAPADAARPDDGELQTWRAVADKLFVPQPDPQAGLIEQFDGYFKLEDVPPDVARSRLKHPDQHPGGLFGPFQSTQAIKQADVALLLYLFRSQYDAAVKRANWEYYEPRTAHDSSLSPMAYALVASDIGRTEWAYRYFKQTATMDLLGAGPHWNLGVHTAAMGGAWAVVVHGFCRLHLHDMGIMLHDWPLLPEGWRRVSFKLSWHGHRVQFHTDGQQTTLRADSGPVPVLYPGGEITLTAGQSFTLSHQKDLHR